MSRTDEQIAAETLLESLSFSRRALACRGWRYLRGAQSLFWQEGIAVGAFCYSDDEGAGWQVSGWRRGEELPNLTDPATRGTLLALVRRAWDDSRAHTEPAPFGGWRCAYGPKLSKVFPTEIEALVWALEDADREHQT